MLIITNKELREQPHAQCSKLRVHLALRVHDLAAGCTHFGSCATGECTLFQSISMLYIGLCTRKNCRVHVSVSLCTRRVHNKNAEFRTLQAYYCLLHQISLYLVKLVTEDDGSCAYMLCFHPLACDIIKLTLWGAEMPVFRRLTEIRH